MWIHDIRGVRIGSSLFLPLFLAAYFSVLIWRQQFDLLQAHLVFVDLHKFAIALLFACHLFICVLEEGQTDPGRYFSSTFLIA